MKTSARRIAFVVALMALAYTRGSTQGPDPSAIVEQLYPTWLRDLGPSVGSTISSPHQCFAVYDTNTSGAPRTIVAGYTDGFTGALRILRDGPAGFEVAAEPSGYIMAGYKCRVTLVDIDDTVGKEIHLSFSNMVSSTDWLFRWDGQRLVNLTPVTPVFDGRLETLRFITGNCLFASNFSPVGVEGVMLFDLLFVGYEHFHSNKF